MRQIEFRAMGCEMLAAIDTDDLSAARAIAQVPTWFAQWESALSRFRTESELSRINRASGETIQVSETFWQVLQIALSAAQASDGLVTPTLLDALNAAGYDRSFEQIAPSSNLGSQKPPPVANWQLIECDAPARTMRVPHGVHLDFGGVAKGWAADQAARRLAEIAPAIVDAGGDIAVSGIMANGDAYPIAVLDPFNPAADLTTLFVDQGGIATSGRDYRHWERNGQPQHHIIDPRTGQPAETDILSATVIAPTTHQAEVAAKVALILGSHAGAKWLDARADYAGLFVLENGTVLKTARLANYEWRDQATEEN